MSYSHIPDVPAQMDHRVLFTVDSKIGDGFEKLSKAMSEIKHRYLLIETADKKYVVDLSDTVEIKPRELEQYEYHFAGVKSAGKDIIK